MLSPLLRKALQVLPHDVSHREALRNALEDVKIRLSFIGSGFVVLLFLITFRMGNMAILQKVPEVIDPKTPPAAVVFGRADIVDRNGLLLATTLRTSSLYADPRIVIDTKEAAASLSKILKQCSEQELYEKLTLPRSFVWLARHLTPSQKAKIISLGIPGIDFREDEKRIYPYGSLASHVIGFADIDNVGLVGIEQSFDTQLRQSNDSFSLSLDVKIQHVVKEELEQSIKEFQADGGAGIVMDMENGEILAMVSLPDFDPNNPDLKSGDKMFNQATLGVYEMGSTMKIINTAMALDSGAVHINSVFDASVPLKVGKFFVTDYHGKNRELNVSEIFKFSSNIGSAKMALAVGTAQQKEFFQRAGLLDKIDLEISEKGQPQSPKKWGDVHTITASYGYGVSITPLHLARAVAGIVNQKGMVCPTLLKINPGTEIKYNKIVSSKTARQVHQLMRLAVTDGGVKKANVPGFYVAGKTGTTNLRKAKGRGYQKKYVRTNFVGMFPKQPKYIVWVMLDSPKPLQKTFGFNAAGWNAAPLAGKIIARVASLLGMIPEFDDE